MTIELEETEKYLKKNGIESPRAETEYIFCHLLNCQRIDLYASGIKLDQFQSQGLQRLIERRAKGEPLQYILGESYFYGFRFKAENGVFIPRPETEILVDAAVRKLSALDHQLSVNILDLCTGCGNIAISLTKTLPRYKIFAIFPARQ
jgi:release factor glutamine methyltransferase